MTVPNDQLDPRKGIVTTSYHNGPWSFGPMSQTATPNVATPATPDVTLADMTSGWSGEHMGRLADRHETLKKSVTEYEKVKSDLQSTVAEFNKRLGVAVSAPAKAKSSTPRAPRQKKDGDKSYPSLK